MGVYTILGNLIVLGIVGIVLILFRKSDKNSKSLEHVKKYAERRNEEFDIYVDEKMVQLKDLSVSLEVQEKTGVVILDRIAGEVDTLSEKIEHIEELNKKVTGYNSTMDKMLNLSTELDERYIKLKKDSGYIDILDKRVKDGRKKLQSIEKNIDDITLEFIKNNNNSVNKLKEEVLSKASDQVTELGNRVNISVLDIDRLSSLISELNNSFNGGAKESYSSFKSDLNSLIESHRKRIEKITAEGESLEAASFSEIKDKINLRSGSLLEILEDKIKLIEEKNSDKISKLSMDMGNVEVIANKIQEENKNRLDSIKKQLDKQLISLRDVNSKGISSLQDEFFINFREFKEQSLTEINNAKSGSQQLVAGLKEQLGEAKEYRNEIVNRYMSTEEYINREFTDFKYRLENSVIEVTKELDGHEGRVKDAAFKQLDKSIYRFKDEVDRKLEDLTSVNERIDSIKDAVLISIDTSRSELDEELKIIQSEFGTDKNKIIHDISILKTDLQVMADKNKILIDQEKQSFVDSISILRESQLSLSSELYNGEQEIRSQVTLQHEILIGNVHNDINERLNNLKDELTLKINTFSDYDKNINSAKDDLEALVLLNHNSIKEKVSLLNESLNTEIAKEKIILHEFINNFNGEKCELEDEIKKLKEISYHSISEKLNIFEDEYFVDLKDKKAFIESETDRWQSQLALSVEKIKDESITTIVENMESVNNKVNIFKDDLTIKLNTFYNESESKLESLISTMHNSESNLLISSEEIKTKVNLDILKLSDQFSIFSNEISDGMVPLRAEMKLISQEQKKYISETQIFTRTDQLRGDLETSLESLTSMLSDVQEKSSFVAITNDKLNTLRSLIESVNAQIESIDGKRGKIESLEGRVSKVLDLSDIVDEKLTSIKSSEEQISEVQLKLRELKELERSISLDFERLEKKDDILVETNRSIDSGFGHIQIIENKLDLLKESLNPFNNQIDNIKHKLSRVEEREAKIDRAITTLSTLDSSIVDLDSKILKMDKAREWIAGVETRLDESVRSAEEQVKLMGALAQNKNENTIRDSNPAPNMDMRDMVVKLAHQGWKPEAISKTTKLSRGEVELILELSPRN